VQCHCTSQGTEVYNPTISIIPESPKAPATIKWTDSYPVEIGPRLRAERERRSMSLRELGKRVSLSPSLISQIETGKARPSVGSLYALTSALGLSIDRLFTGPSDLARGNHADPDGTRESADHQVPPLVVRATNRKAIDLDSGVRWERLTAASHPDVDFLHVVYAPGGASAATMTRHGGREFGIVISGTLTVTVNFDDYVLWPGDSIAFPSTTPHRLWNAGDEPVQAIWLVVGRHRTSESTGPLT